MFCDRCDEPITPGEPYITVDNPGTSGAGSVVFVHKELCVRPPRQTAPSSPRPSRAGQ